MSWTTAQTRAQYAAIAHLRWRISVNSFRRKGGVGDVLSYVIMLPIALLFAGGLCSAAGFTAYAATSSGHIVYTRFVFLGIFILTLLVNINLGQPGTTFDPTQLIRFPLTPGNYTFIRLFFGVLSLGNILIGLLSLSAAIGILVASPALWAPALIAAACFALANVLFTRMVFTWVDRWLSTRRAREVFTAIIFIVSMGFQYWNVHYNLGSSHHHQQADADESPAEAAQTDEIQHRVDQIKPYIHILDFFPNGLAGNALAAADQHRTGLFLAETAGSLAWSAFFLAIFGLRMRTEFRGENLSDQANATGKQDVHKVTATHAAPAMLAHTEPAVLANKPQPAPSVIATILAKEFLYIRRNTGLFYGLIAPLIMVFLFAGKLAVRGSAPWIFPASLAYALLGVVPINFNSFGLDGIGSQIYFLTPVRMRDVLLAKNILNSVLAVVEIAAVFVLIAYVAGVPSLNITISTVLWTTATLLVELTVGNYRSISAPRRIDPGRTAQKQARPLSALASMGILLVAAGVGASLMLLVRSFPEIGWILPVSMLVFTAVAAVIYWSNLNRMDEYALRHRDSLFEELSRKA